VQTVARLTILITLNDVEPAVRLNAALESEGVQTAVVSPLDDIRSALERERPDIIVFSGDLTEPSNVALVKEQLWVGTAAVGLTDNPDPSYLERLRLIGFVDVYRKPLNVLEAVAGLRGILERRRLQKITGLMGESEAMTTPTAAGRLPATVSFRTSVVSATFPRSIFSSMRTPSSLACSR